MESFGEEVASSQQRYYNNYGNSNIEATNTILAFNVCRNANKKKKYGKKRFLTEERHKNNANPDLVLHAKKIAKWRMRERMKTVSVALVYCLNIGVDPPDLMKTEPCARLECWIDPQSQPQQKALESIGKALQTQYERWQSRARYKISLDPTVDEVKKLCLSLRRNSKDERVLFHYNGHGVPRPTANGEIWVFNKNYTQYIPLSIYELQTWMGSPSIYVFDCSAAGTIVNWFLQFADQREKEYEKLAASSGGSAPTVVPVKDFIILAASGVSEVLPMNPDLPADVFTSCLTTPIKMALRWFVFNSLLVRPGITFDMLDQIPGRLADRRTPLGELNWIFTAITDTIAWNILPRELFQKLFRQDLLVASLFRNFLLAERIMRTMNCTPISYPKLPSGTHQHPMWQTWDLAVDMCLSQLPDIIEDPTIEYKFSPFFSDQLTAFEVWLEFGSENKKPPEQLPIVLQVLLSQAHRLRALYLLGRFLDLGPWAVNLALSVGIFPYVLKLLQSPAIELCQILVFMWAKILALDKSCQLDLVKDNGHNYFINVLSSSGAIDSEQRAMAAFILSVIANNCRPGQSACIAGNLLQLCLQQLSDPDPLLRRWILLCLAKLWESYEDAKWVAVREGAHEKLCSILSDPVPEVRAAVVYALGTFIGGADGNEQRTTIEINLGLTLLIVTGDASPVVRKELIVALSRLVRCYERQFKSTAAEVLEERRKLRSSKSNEDISVVDNNEGSIYGVLWKVILSLVSDPYPELAKMAESVVKIVLDQITPQSSAPMSPPPNRKAKLRPKGLAAFRSNPNLAKLGKENGAPPSPLKKTGSFDFSKDEEEPPPLPSEEIQSTFYEWSCEYFSKPLLNAKDYDDETSPHWSHRRWKQQSVEAALTEARSIHQNFNSNILYRFDEQVAILDNSPDSVSSLILHSVDPIIAISDDKDGLSIWDRETCQRLHSWRNRSIESTSNIASRTTGMAFVNEHDTRSLLVTGSDDGVVRVWSHFDSPSKHNLVSGWRPIVGLVPGGRGAGLLLHWQQDFGQLLTTGDVGVIRIYDLERELLIQDVSTASDHSVTCLSSAAPATRCFAAGYSDGSVRLFDQRVPPKFSLVASFIEHNQWVVNVNMPKVDTTKLISGSITSEVKFWDIRESSSSTQPTKNPSIKSFVAHSKGVMTALTVHDYAPVLATGSQAQKVKVFNFNGDEMSLIRYHDGFLGQRIGPISCLSFHPYRMLLAAGATDSIVSLYTRR